MNQELVKEIVDKIYVELKRGYRTYDEEVHCKMILRIMLNKGRVSAFCTEAMICEKSFYEWCKRYELFMRCYALGKMFARESWEEEGEELKDYTAPIGTISHNFEHWKLIGWSRFGISKNSRIKLDLNPESNPSQHYKQLLQQASNGDFTAAEIKQLMEAVNVGLNTHQVFELQKQIDELKSDLSIMSQNTNGNDTISNKGFA